MSITDTLTSERTYYRLSVRQKPTTRYTWNAVAKDYEPTETRERAWSSPIFLTVFPVFHVNPNDPLCGGKTRCYNTIQGAINDAGDDALIKVVEGTYHEAVKKNNSGAVAVSGGWNETFTSQTSGASSMYAPQAGEGATLTVQEFRIVPQN
jgi:hypothetical protein